MACDTPKGPLIDMEISEGSGLKVGKGKAHLFLSLSILTDASPASEDGACSVVSDGMKELNNVESTIEVERSSGRGRRNGLTCLRSCRRRSG